MLNYLRPLSVDPPLSRIVGPLPALGVADEVEIGGSKPKAPSKKRTPKPATTSPEPQPSQPTDGSPRGQVRDS